MIQTKNIQLKHFIYVRKSTRDEKRQVLSIGSQFEAADNIAGTNCCNVIQRFAEEQSALKPGRPLLNEMLDRIERGEANAIICWKLDRLARNMVDGGRIIQMLQDGSLKEIRTYEKLWTPVDNVIHLAIEFGSANQYSRDLSVNLKRGIRTRLSQGIWPGVARLGYYRVPGTRRLVMHPSKGPLVRKVFKLAAKGTHSIREIRDLVFEQGLRGNGERSLTISATHRILHDGFYHGVFEYGGAKYEGVHDKLVSKELFDQVQAILRVRTRPRKRELKRFLYRRTFRCGECGCYITTETQKGHNYLHCTKRRSTCVQKYVREEIIGGQIDKLVHDLALPRIWINFCESEIVREKVLDAKAVEKRVQLLSAALAELDVKLDRYLDLLAERTISQNEYAFKRDRLEAQRAKLSEELRLSRTDHGTRFEPLEEFIRGLNEATVLDSVENPSEKLRFLRKTGSNLSIRDGLLIVDWKKGWNCAVLWQRKLVLVNRKSAKNPSRSTMRRFWNDIRTTFIPAEVMAIGTGSVVQLRDQPNVLVDAREEQAVFLPGAVRNRTGRAAGLGLELVCP